MKAALCFLLICFLCLHNYVAYATGEFEGEFLPPYIAPGNPNPNKVNQIVDGVRKIDFVSNTDIRLANLSAVAYSTDKETLQKRTCESWKWMHNVQVVDVEIIPEGLYFTAVNNFLRRVYVVFRGTMDSVEALRFLDVDLVPLINEFPDFKVHKGYSLLYHEMREKLRNSLNRIVAGKLPQETTFGRKTRSGKLYKRAPWKIYLTGHSKGGALAQLLAADLAISQPTLLTHVRIVTFASPRVLGCVASAAVETAAFSIRHYLEETDIIPVLPSKAMFFRRPGAYLRMNGATGVREEFSMITAFCDAASLSRSTQILQDSVANEPENLKDGSPVLFADLARAGTNDKNLKLKPLNGFSSIQNQVHMIVEKSCDEIRSQTPLHHNDFFGTVDFFKKCSPPKAEKAVGTETVDLLVAYISFQCAESIEWEDDSSDTSWYS